MTVVYRSVCKVLKVGKCITKGRGGGANKVLDLVLRLFLIQVLQTNESGILPKIAKNKVCPSPPQVIYLSTSNTLHTGTYILQVNK
jgi:hypothetical protein